MPQTRKRFHVDLDGASVLSLDVFDTCLLRQVAHPTYVFDLIEQELAYTGGLQRFSGGSYGFCELRVRAESRARTRLSQSQKTPEVTLDEIYAELMRMTGMAMADASLLKDLELEFERRVIVPNPEILALARDAHERGLLVVYVSDMYLPSAVIAELLARSGFDVAPGHVFVSAEYRKAKWSGDLFHIVANTLSIALRKFVHVGDNMEADVVAPRKLGIRSYHYEKLSERLLKEEASVRSQSSRALQRPARSLSLGMRDAALSYDLVARSCPPGDDDFWFRLGYERAGILFLGFTTWLLQQCQRDNIDSVVFLARDGHIVKECFDTVCAWQGVTLPSLYMYASRRALVFPALMSVADGDIEFLGSGKYQDVATYLRRCGLEPDAYEREVLEAGFASVDQQLFTYEDWKQLRTLFQKLAPRILQATAAESKLALSYLDQLDIPKSGRLAVVDIGWHGTMQEALEKLLRLSGRSTTVTGYYVGLHPRAQKWLDRGQHMKGYLAHAGKPEDIYSWIYSCVELVEFLFLAPHGSTLGFVDVDGTIHPRLEDNGWEADNVAKAARVRQGVRQFFEAVQPFVERFPHAELDPRGAFFPYAQVIMDPTAEEARLLGDLSHVEGFGQSERRYIAKPNAIPPTERGAHEQPPFWTIGYAKRRKRSRR